MVNWKKLKANIPHFVQVNRKAIYEILYTDEFLDGKTLGETRFNPRQIVIKNGMTPKETVKTYYHELQHAFSEEYGAKLTENQVLALEQGAYYWFKSNNIFRLESKNVRKRSKKRRTKVR